MFAIDPAFDEPVDGVEEVVAVKARVKAEDRAAQQTFEQQLFPRADAERFCVRPGNVPERDDRCIGQQVANHARRQREVIVLDEHHRVVGPRFVRHGFGEPPIDLLIIVPIFFAKDRWDEHDVAQRPESFVGQAEVVAVLFLIGQPDSAEFVRGRIGRDIDARVRVDRVAVGRAPAVGDPRAAAGAHDGLERRNDAAGRRLNDDARFALIVDVRLAV